MTKIKTYYIPAFLIGWLTFLYQPLFSQVGRAALLGAYTYNFARYTSWPDEKADKAFSILLISSDSSIIREFESLAKNRKIKNKFVDIEIHPTVPKPLPERLKVIVLPKDKNRLFDQVYPIIQDRPILLVSENHPNQRNVMINLFENSEQSLVFEVNKANVINHGLTIDPEILLMGGTEIDIARLYRSSQQSMDSMQRQMQQIADSIFRLNETITQSREQIDRQQDRILEQKSMLAEQNTKIENGLKEIEAHEQEIASHKKEILRQLKELNMQRMSLKEQELEITEQESYNQQQQNDIRESKKILDSLWLEIDQKNIELVEQGELIRRQKQISLLTTLAGFLSIVALLSLIYGFRSKAKKNKILTQQKKKMEQINARLNATNKSLYDTIRRLSEAQSQLVASEKMASLGVLTAGIAHEINNPVNFIYTGINSLNNDMNDLRIFIEEVDELLKNSGINELIDRVEALKTERDFDEIMEIIPQTIDDIRIGAERAADIIKGLRNFSRIDKDALQYYNIHEGIDSSLLLLRNKLKNHIEIVKDYRQLPQIECYPGKLNQVFMNLLSNAIDAIDKKGTITIRTRLEGEDRITIEVEDTGKGIHPENLGKIFDPFFTTKSVGKGVGLGLSISFGIIKDHDGTIDVKSDRNKGSIFTISLPCNINRDKKP